jgi:hypothetical protein
MGEAVVTLPDGRRAKVTFTDRAQLDAVVADMTKTAPPKPATSTTGLSAPQQNSDLMKTALSAMPYGSAIDTGLAVGSEFVGGMLGGVVSAGGYANQALGMGNVPQNEGGKPPDQLGAEVSSALTYTPRTEAGKHVVGAIHRGMQAFEDWSDTQGQQAAQFIAGAGKHGADIAAGLGAPAAVVDFIRDHSDEIGAAYGAATKTMVNAAPMVMGNEVPGVLRAGARSVTDRLAPRPAMTEPNPTTGPIPLDGGTVNAPRGTNGPTLAAGTPPAATGAPRATPTDVGGGALPDTPTGRAQAYARDRLGISWTDLGDSTRAKLTAIAQSAGGLDKLNVDETRRYSKLQSMREPVPTTRGHLSRDANQLLKEDIAASSAAGSGIRKTNLDANTALRRNVDYLLDQLRGVGNTKATSTGPEQVGRAVAGRDTETPGALTLAQRQARRRTQAAYEKARATEPDVQMPTDPLYEVLNQSPAMMNLDWVKGWLNKAKVEVHRTTGTAGEQIEVTERRPLKAVELDDLRKLAEKHQAADPVYAPEIKQTIDQLMQEGTPEGSKAWKEARDAHIAERQEFGNQAAIARLVENKGGRYGVDPKVAMEDVWDKGYRQASLEEVRQLKRSLAFGKTPDARLAGKKALRELRLETGRDFLRNITKSGGTNELGEPNITSASIDNWLKSLGDGTVDGGVEKLKVLVGNRAARQFMDIREAAQITKTQPTGTGVSGSSTWNKAVSWMEDSGLGHVAEGLLGPIAGLAKGIKNAAQNPLTAAKAATTPLDLAADAQETQLRAIQQQQAPGPQTLGQMIQNEYQQATRPRPSP